MKTLILSLCKYCVIGLETILSHEQIILRYILSLLLVFTMRGEILQCLFLQGGPFVTKLLCPF
jgi:hypothetical protein